MKIATGELTARRRGKRCPSVSAAALQLARREVEEPDEVVGAVEALVGHQPVGFAVTRRPSARPRCERRRRDRREPELRPGQDEAAKKVSASLPNLVADRLVEEVPVGRHAASRRAGRE
jgi:hypothetical protein